MASFYRSILDWFNIEYGDNVSGREAMTLPAMWYGVSKISGHCGRLPLFIHKKLQDGGSRKAESHWAYDLIKSRPNGYQTADVFREQLTAHAILWGNGRAAIINPGTPEAELIPLLPDRTDTMMLLGEKVHITKIDKDDRISLYESIEEDPRKTVMLYDKDVYHVQGFGFDGVQGLSLVSMMRRALRIPISQEEHALNQTKKGFAAKILLEAPPGALRDEDKAKEFIESFNKANSSSDNAGKAALLREGMKASVVSMNNGDAQFVEQRRFSRQDVMLMLGLDGMPGDGDNHSYNSKEMENLNYLDNALGRWISRHESQVDMKILTAKERRLGYYSRFNLAALLRTDTQTQASVISTFINARVLNPNESRELLDRNPYDGGDEYINPAISQAEARMESSSDNNSSATAILETSVRGLVRREANDAKNGANKTDFCGWIDAHYSKWENKLAAKLEDLGIDRDRATDHCEESKEMLLNVAGSSTPEQLRANVEKCVANWENRVYKLLGINEYA